MAPSQILLWSLLAVTLLISAATDLASRRILDAVTYPMAVVALGLRCWNEGLGNENTGLISGLVGVALGVIPFALFAWRGKMGWGDVKLMGAVGAALGFPLVVAALVFVSLAGAAQAVAALVLSGKLKETFAHWGRRWAVRMGLGTAGVAEPSRQIPYGVAIALGTLWAMWWDQSGSRY